MSIATRVAGVVDAVKSVFSVGDSAAHVWAWVTTAFGGWGSSSYARLVKLAATNAYTSRGLRLISQTMATVPLSVYKADGKEDAGHWLPALLARPRPGWTWRRTCEAVVWALYCGGRVYVERVVVETGPKRGQASRLRFWAPDKLQSVDRDTAGDVVTYNFGGQRGRPHSVPAEHVLDVRCLDPLNFEEGAMPILLGARRALVAVENQDEWNASVAKGKGQVSGFLMPKIPDGKTLSPEQVTQAQEGTDKAFSGREAGGPPLVMNGLFDYQSGSVTPKAAEALGIRTMSSREVAAVLGFTSDALLAGEKSGSLTDAGVNSEVRALLLLTVLPFLDMVLGELTAWLLPGAQRLAYDVDQIDALGEDVNAKWKRYGEAAGVIVSVNESREGLGYARLGPEHDIIAGAPDPLPPTGGDGSTRGLPPTWQPSTAKALTDRVADIIAHGDGRAKPAD